MKYILLALFLFNSIPAQAQVKVVDLTEDTAPASTDLGYSVKSSTLARKVQWGNVTKLSGFQDNGTTVQAVTTSDNVAIGTSTASTKLQVLGTVTATAFVGDGSALTGISGGVGGSSTPGGSGSEIQYRGGATTLSAVVGSGVDVNGNIGLGTTMPDAKLTLLGSAGAYNIYDYSYGIIGTTNTPQLSFKSARGTQASPTAATTDDRVGVVIGSAYAGSSTGFRNTSALTFYSSEAQTASAGGSYIGFETTANGATSRLERMRISPAGNLGVGTTNPGTALDVSGTIRATAIRVGANSVCQSDGTNCSVSGNVGIGTANFIPTYISASALGPTNMRHVAGNIGIGTATPGQALDVTGVVRSSAGFISTNAGQFNFATNQGIGFDPVNATYATPKLLLTSGGNVGIATASPGTPLDIQGTVRTTAFQLSTNPSAGYVLTSTSVGVGTWMPSSAGSGSGTVTSSTINTVAKFAATGTTVQGSAILFDTATNVGVGTSVPLALLDVNRKLTVFAGGNVGIGTITPGQVLDVNGTIRSTASGVSTFTGGNVGIATLNPGTLLDVFGGRIRTVGIGTTVPQAACIKADGTLGYYTTTTFAGTCL